LYWIFGAFATFLISIIKHKDSAIIYYAFGLLIQYLLVLLLVKVWRDFIKIQEIIDIPKYIELFHSCKKYGRYFFIGNLVFSFCVSVLLIGPLLNWNIGTSIILALNALVESLPTTSLLSGILTFYLIELETVRIEIDIFQKKIENYEIMNADDYFMIYDRMRIREHNFSQMMIYLLLFTLWDIVSAITLAFTQSKNVTSWKNLDLFVVIYVLYFILFYVARQSMMMILLFERIGQNNRLANAIYPILARQSWNERELERLGIIEAMRACPLGSSILFVSYRPTPWQIRLQGLTLISTFIVSSLKEVSVILTSNK
jgi:hypothetical protein